MTQAPLDVCLRGAGPTSSASNNNNNMDMDETTSKFESVVVLRPSSPHIGAGLERGMALQQQQEPQQPRQDPQDVRTKSTSSKMSSSTLYPKLGSISPTKRCALFKQTPVKSAHRALSKKKLLGGCGSFMPPPPPLYSSQSCGSAITATSCTSFDSRMSLDELLRDESLNHLSNPYGYDVELEGDNGYSNDYRSSMDNKDNDRELDLNDLEHSQRLARMLDEAAKVAVEIGDEATAAAFSSTPQQQQHDYNDSSSSLYGYGYSHQPQPHLAAGSSSRRRRYQRRNSFVIHRNRGGRGMMGSAVGSGSAAHLFGSLNASCPVIDTRGICDGDEGNDSGDDTTMMMCPPPPAKQSRHSSLGPLGLPRHEGKLVFERFGNQWKHQQRHMAQQGRQDQEDVHA